MTQTIHPADIESELQRIWESLEGTNKMRACLYNLIIYSGKNKRTDYLRSLVGKMIEKFPSRIIFVTKDEEAVEDTLETSVSVLTAGEGENEIVCDLINLHVTAGCSKKIPFLILPHLLPDLPIYLVFAEDPCKQDPLSYRIERFANRIIYDSETSDSLSTFAQTVLQHEKEIGSQIADLNWGRIESWRNLFIDTFQSKEALEDLKDAETIHIYFNGAESKFYCHTRIQSIFFQTWLGSRLGWQWQSIAQKNERTECLYEGENGPINVILHPDHMQEIPAGRILRIEVTTKAKNSYVFARNPDCPHHIRIDVATPKACQLPKEYIFDKDKIGLSLIKEMTHSGTSEHFKDVLHKLSAMKEIDACHTI